MDDHELDDLLSQYRERVGSYDDEEPGYGRRWGDWCRVLLGHGGQLVVPHLAPEHRVDMLAEGAGAHTGPVRFVMGEGSQCHANVVRLWAAGDVEAIGTGYALSGGLWRQHSWGLDGETVVETTAPRSHYVGVVLAGADAAVFAVSNDVEAVEEAMAADPARAAAIVGLLETVIQEQSSGRS